MKRVFEINGKKYLTDNETLRVLRSIVPAAKKAADSSAVAAILHLGLQIGRIKEV